MKVTRLKLANVRAIKAAELRFEPGFNLVIGVNGVGKTTVLRTLAICLSEIVRGTNREVTRTSSTERFDIEDVRVGGKALTVECGVEIKGEDFTYVVHKPRRAGIVRKKSSGMPREQLVHRPELYDFLGESPRLARDRDPGGRPFALLFGVGRASQNKDNKEPTRGSTYGGIRSAVSGALTNRSLRSVEFMEWMRVQQRLRKESQSSRRALVAIEKAVRRFLPGYTSLRVVRRGPKPELCINHGRATLAVRQLSDGERGILALVFDLTRRLTLANPTMADPAAMAEAIVLIDEIDLHLHPGWQRQVVRNLIAAFPRCQFIATTHSPQIVGEVAHNQIQIMTNEMVYAPTHSFGVDSSRVLEEIMGAEPRAREAKQLLSQLSRRIEQQHFDEARKLLVRLANRLGDDDPDVIRARTLLDFMGGSD
ncbi:MAG: AAA family ATPase [Anaerolineales bacterium]|nr:AAA family ATPase [Anaerolineales bacterium]